MRKTFIMLLLFSITLLASTSYANNTASIDIPNIDKKTVTEAIVSDMMADGWNTQQVNDYQLLFRKQWDNLWGNVFYGSRYNTQTELQYQYNVLQAGTNIRVTANAVIITNPNSAFEKHSPMNTEGIQAYLSNLNHSFNGWIGFGFSYDEKKKDDCYVVKYVWPGGPFDKAGIKVGDKIKWINSKPVNDMRKKEFDKLLDGPEGSSATFTIQDTPKHKHITVSKGFVPPTRRPFPQQPIIEKKNDLTFGFKYGLMDADGCVQVIEIIPGSSAEKEGLKIGDKIAKVNGVPLNKYDADTFNKIMGGPEGSTIMVTLKPTAPGEQEKIVLLEKILIKI